MKSKHIEARIQQCIAIAACSPCIRRKFGALLVDPVRNVILMDGYNGGPRGDKGTLCGGHFCHRDGVPEHEIVDGGTQGVVVRINGETIHRESHHATDGMAFGPNGANLPTARERAEAWIQDLQRRYPGVPSGTHMEVGCHHAEMNVLTNAAARGVATAGAWLIVTGEPCLLCAKLIHHAGIDRVICVKGGYMGGDNGPHYLQAHGVHVEYVDGPPDPRTLA